MAKKIYLGRKQEDFFRRKLHIPHEEARQHWHVMGITGSGKSRFLAHLYIELIQAGYAVSLIDPHGDLGRLVLGHLIQRDFFKAGSTNPSLLYLDIPQAARKGRYLPFNVLKQKGSPYTVASNVMDAMHRTWPALAGGSAPRFDRLVQNGIKVLVSNDLPLPYLERLLTDKDFRAELLINEMDPDVKRAWRDWFDALPDKLQLEYADSTLSRVNLLTFDPVLKFSLGQKENVLNFRTNMDQGISSIINLAIENAEARRLFGSLITVQLEQAALSRAELLDEDRGRGHFMLLDEFAQFVAQSGQAFSTMLSQTRKYRLWSILAHQVWDQADKHLQSSLQNVGLEVLFGLGAADAAAFSKVIGQVDPVTVSEATDHETRESFGMNEQLEEWRQELYDLPPRYAYVNKKNHHRRWMLLWKKPAREIERVKTPTVPDSTASKEEIEAIEAAYLARYFRPVEEIDLELKRSDPLPAKRVSEVK